MSGWPRFIRTTATEWPPPSRRLPRRGASSATEWRVNLPEGEPERWLMSRGRPVLGADGMPERYIGIVFDITESRRLTAERDQWANAFRHCAHGIAIGLPASNTIYACNPAFAELLGYAQEEIAGVPIPAVYAPAEHAHLLAQIAEADAQGKNRYESVMQRKDGSTFDVQMDVVSVKGPDGCLLYRVATMVDISGRKRTELALMQSEARYRALMETSFDWMWEVGTDDIFTFASKQIEEILGYKPHEIVGLTPFDLMPPEEGERVRAIFDGIKSERRHFQRLENTSLHKDGHKVIVETSGVPSYAPDGSWIGYRGFDRDVTATRHATAELAAERQRLRTLIDAVPDLIWVKDPDGVYLLCNPPFERLYGAVERDIVGRTDYDFVSRDLADSFRENDRKAIASGKPSVNQEWLVFADDRHRALHETIKTPVYDAQGQVLGVLGIARDITGLNAAREVLEQSQHVLEELVDARTSELQASEEKLRLILESSADGLIGMDASGCATFANAAAESMLGYPPGGLLGRELHAAIHHTSADGNPWPLARCPIREALEQRRTVRVESDNFWRADGTSFPVGVFGPPHRARWRHLGGGARLLGRDAEAPGGTSPRAGPGGGGAFGAGQERATGQHEPRDPHPPECGAGPGTDGLSQRRGEPQGAARFCAHPGVRQAVARDRQRHTRLFQGRGRHAARRKRPHRSAGRS